ncbi:MAG: helix-turn-helix transcriptional regulator [Eubacteriales bacterium]
MIDLYLFGKRIAALRKRAGFTQKELACKVGVTPQAVSKWENGACFPDFSIIDELAAAAGVTVEGLLGLTKQE